jgi:hypothetical protein
MMPATASGYRLTAVILAVLSLAGIPPALSSPAEAVGFVLTPVERLDFLACGAAGLVAAWALWRQQRAAPEYYLVWAAVVLAASVHLSISMVPRMLGLASEWFPWMALPTELPPGAVVWNLLLNAGLLGLGYWQLARHRPMLHP